jgi:hypothetical protein
LPIDNDVSVIIDDSHSLISSSTRTDSLRRSSPRRTRSPSLRRSIS